MKEPSWPFSQKFGEKKFKNHDVFVVLVENNIFVKKNLLMKIAAHIALNSLKMAMTMEPSEVPLLDMI